MSGAGLKEPRRRERFIDWRRSGAMCPIIKF